MNAMWSAAKLKVSHRLAMHLRVSEGFRMRNDHPMVSFTFDDVPKSGVTTGAAMLEGYGARGTFYVSGGLTGIDTDAWEACTTKDIIGLHRRGHEIGCHTFSHARVPDLDDATLADEIGRNRRYFHALDPSIKAETFAYPYGYASFARKKLLAREFQSCRGILPGVNSGVVDLQFLRSTPLIDGEIDQGGIDRAFDEAQSTNGWLIFFGHDVAERPSPFGCTPGLLKHALEAASTRKIEVLTMAEALRCARA
jgi:peptidoglycan/xylan/chitin deacetylase (PgdA/CDA1 family)